MKAKIGHSSYLINFLDNQFSSDEITKKVEPELDNILDFFAPKALNGWELRFSIIYSGNDKIALFRKSRSSIDEKSKEIVVHIPIPTQEEVDWGVERDQIIKKGFSDNVARFADFIDIDPSCYSSREEFIVECSKKAIIELFQLGFTVNKIRVKAKNV